MTTSVFKKTIVICWDEEQQAFIADVPDLLICSGSGPTYAEALDSVLEALQWWEERTHRTQQQPTPRLPVQPGPGKVPSS
jgi:predicted RNase H-like HicB family nuclease